MPIRLLVVDDHRLVREGLVYLLSDCPGIEIVGAIADGAGAIESAAALHPDVVLLDIALPDIDGLDVIEEIRTRSPKTRVLMVSMHSEAEYARVAAERGASGLISKSACPECLVDAIRCVARGEFLPIEGELSPREREILERIAAGKTNAEIGKDLTIREKTVDGHCERLMGKLGIHTRAGLVAYGRRVGL